MRFRPVVLTASCALALVGIAASAAYADMPPPIGYIETGTVDNEARSGATCVECAGHFYAQEECSRKLRPDGFVKRCETHGASHWTEVWCKGGNGKASAPPTNDGRSPTPQG